MDVYSPNTISQNKIGKSTIIKKIILPLFLTLTFLCVSEKDIYGQKYTITEDDISSQDEEVILSKLQYNSLQEGRQTPAPQPRYSMSDLAVRLNTYTFLKPFLNAPLPIAGSAIASAIQDSSGSSLGFFRDDGIFLITIPRIEAELAKFQNIANDALDETMLYIQNIYVNNDDLSVQRNEWRNITKTIEDIKNSPTSKDATDKINKLEARKKEIKASIIPIVKKRSGNIRILASKLEEACKGSRDLLLIMADLQKRLECTVTYGFSQEEKDILKSDYEITKDVYERVRDLFKKTYRWESELGKQYLERWH